MCWASPKSHVQGAPSAPRALNETVSGARPTTLSASIQNVSDVRKNDEAFSSFEPFTLGHWKTQFSTVTPGAMSTTSLEGISWSVAAAFVSRTVPPVMQKLTPCRGMAALPTIRQPSTVPPVA